MMGKGSNAWPNDLTDDDCVFDQVQDAIPPCADCVNFLTLTYACVRDEQSVLS